MFAQYLERHTDFLWALSKAKRSVFDNLANERQVRRKASETILTSTNQENSDIDEKEAHNNVDTILSALTEPKIVNSIKNRRSL